MPPNEKTREELSHAAHVWLGQHEPQKQDAMKEAMSHWVAANDVLDQGNIGEY